MKIQVLTILFITIFKSSSQAFKPNLETTSIAIAQIIDSMSEEYNMKFDIVTIEKHQILDKLIAKISNKTRSPIEIHRSLAKEPAFKIGNSSIVLFYKRKFVRMKHVEVLMSHKKIVIINFYIRKILTNEEAPKLTFNHELYEHIFLNLYQHIDGSLKLFSNIRFSKESCSSISTLVNEFSPKILKWKMYNFTQEHDYNNFYKCPIPLIFIANTFVQFSFNAKFLTFKELLNLFQERYNLRWDV